MPIAIAEYDPCWPRDFERARAELLAALGAENVIGFEHIGSTSVPLLAAKPIVDMLAGVHSLAWVESARSSLEALHYAPWFGEPGRVSFERRTADGAPTHHLHAVVWGSRNWLEPLRFRDALRADSAQRMAYERLKRRLAAEHSETRTYTAAKSEFILAALQSTDEARR